MGSAAQDHPHNLRFIENRPLTSTPVFGVMLKPGAIGRLHAAFDRQERCDYWAMRKLGR